MLNVQNVVLLIFIFIACLANILTNVKFRYCKSRCCKTQISISEFKSIHLFSDSLHHSQFSFLVQEQILGWWLVRNLFDHHFQIITAGFLSVVLSATVLPFLWHKRMSNWAQVYFHNLLF